MYGYSVVVIPIQSVLAPHNPYALKNSHAVWALSGSLVMSGVAQWPNLDYKVLPRPRNR